MKVWNMNETEPEMLEKKNLGVGEVLAGGFCKYTSLSVDLFIKNLSCVPDTQVI